MVKVDIDDAILLIVVKRKPDPTTEVDGVLVLQPTSVQDAMRIQTALTSAQKTLLELTKRAIDDGAKKAEK
jgi:hypothetical protein